jgi:guanine nucleotide-binding protein subunit alpha
MCFGGSSKDDAGAQKSKEIERQLKDDQKKLAKEVKLLLLGECCAYDCRAGDVSSLPAAQANLRHSKVRASRANQLSSNRCD